MGPLVVDRVRSATRTATAGAILVGLMIAPCGLLVGAAWWRQRRRQSC